MKLIRILSIVIALLMVMSCFISCKKNNEEGGEETTVSTTDPDAPNPMYDEDGGGRDFVFLTRDHTEEFTYSYLEVGAEDTGEGERVSSAVYNRDNHIEETFNINIVVEPVKQKDYAKTLENDVLGNVGGYDVVMPMISTAFSAASKGYLIEFGSLPYVDIEQDYWNTEIYNSTSISGYNFFAVGEANISSYNSVGALYFNKKLVDDKHLDDPYELVRNNQWTFTAMKEMTVEVTEDIDGDTTDMTYKDRWGFCSSAYMWMPLFYSSGYMMIEKDDEDMPYLSGISPENSEVVNTLLTTIATFLNDNNSCLSTHDPKNEFAEIPSGMGLRTDMFVNGDRALFWMEGIYGQYYLRNMSSEYGILPIPKWNPESPYAAIAHQDHTSAMALTTCTQDIGLSAAVIEEMALSSAGNEAGKLKEEFYEQTIRVRGSRDDASYEMLDYLYETVVMDLALVMKASGLGIDGTVRTMVQNNNSNFTGMFSTSSQGFELVLGELNNKYIEVATSQLASSQE